MRRLLKRGEHQLLNVFESRNKTTITATTIAKKKQQKTKNKKKNKLSWSV